MSTWKAPDPDLVMLVIIATFCVSVPLLHHIFLRDSALVGSRLARRGRQESIDNGTQSNPAGLADVLAPPTDDSTETGAVRPFAYNDLSCDEDTGLPAAAPPVVDVGLIHPVAAHQPPTLPVIRSANRPELLEYGAYHAFATMELGLLQIHNVEDRRIWLDAPRPESIGNYVQLDQALMDLLAPPASDVQDTAQPPAYQDVFGNGVESRIPAPPLAVVDQGPISLVAAPGDATPRIVTLASRPERLEGDTYHAQVDMLQIQDANGNTVWVDIPTQVGQ